jgi:signal transduction histidine kinase/ligand-binding sensor domain-containing protein
MVTHLLEDHEGALWAGSRNGISRFLNSTWESLGIPEGLDEKAVESLYEDGDYHLWVRTSAGLYQRVAGEQRFHHVSGKIGVRAATDDAPHAISTSGIERILQDMQAPGSVKPVAGLVRTAPGYQVLTDRNGNSWVGTLGEGLFWRSSDASSVLQHLRSGALSSDFVRSLYEDRDGNIWVGTHNGLNRLSKRAIRSAQVNNERGYELIRGITRGPGCTLWVGTNRGLYRVSENKGAYAWSKKPAIGAVSAMHTDARGRLWIAAGGLVGHFEDDKDFVPLSLQPSVSWERVLALTTDSGARVWLGGSEIGLYQLADGHLRALKSLPEVGDRQPTVAITDGGGRVWVGFYDGTVLRYAEGSFTVFSKSDGLAGGRVLAIYADAKDRLWVGSFSGLSRLDGNRFVALHPGNGFPDGSVGAIAEDESGALWVGMTSGIARLQPSDYDRAVVDSSYRIPYTFYDGSDGLRGEPTWLSTPSVVRTCDGRLWFSTSDGFAVIHPDSLEGNPPPPSVRLEGVTLNERRLAGLPRRLPSTSSRVEISYSTANFSAPTNVRFRYRLQGFDSDWVEAGTRQQAVYTNLAPGRYTFSVVASKSGVWPPSGAVWDFAVAPAFYQTGWFQLSGLAALVATGFVGWHLRIRHVRRQYSLVLAERVRVSREIHDTLLQTLVGVTLQFETLLSRLDPADEVVTDGINRMRRQVETCIREARRTICDLRELPWDEHDLADALRRAADEVAATTPVKVAFRIDGRPVPIAPHVQQQLVRIGREAVTNAVRHGGPTELQIDLSFAEDSVLVRVTDNGRGFDITAPRLTPEEHWGLTSMQERAEQIGAQFQLTSAAGRGTQIEVVAPVASGHRNGERG